MSESTQTRGSLLIISAPSGGGKSSLSRALVEWMSQRGMMAMISVSYTTRAPRPGEIDGQHYHFVDEARFLQMIGDNEFLEHAEVFGRRYGTGAAATESLLAAGVDVILDIDWQGAREVKRIAPEAAGIFILPPSVAELERRLYGRGQDSAEAVAARMRQARAEMAHHAEYDYLVVNDRFEFALEQLASIALERRLRHAAQARRQAALLAELLDSPTPIR